MATSDPFARAQDVKRCQLCPGKHRKSPAETVCNTCHVNLCRDCVGHHMTSNPIKRHDVVTFHIKKLEIKNKVHEQPIKELSEKPEVIAALKTGYTNTYRVCCIPNTDKFYVSGSNYSFKRMDTEGTLLRQIDTKSEHAPSDLTVTRGGDLVYTDWGGRSINRRKNDKTECLIRLPGWTPRAICSTSTDDLLITMMSDRVISAKVVRYSGSTFTQEIQFSDKGKPLYSNPAFITENKNIDIVVSDSDTKTVVVVDKDGKFMFSYDGNVQLKKSFYPRGVTTDSMCHILIADRDNHIIHIIDQNGQFLQYIDNCNLYLPHDLSIDSNDMLFVTEVVTNILKQIRYSD